MANRKHILLITESMLHYRISLYDKFTQYFEKENYRLYVFSNQRLKEVEASKIEYWRGDFRVDKLIKLTKKIKPDYVIFFWNIYNLNSWAFMIWCKLNQVKFIYWSHGMSLQDPNNKVKKTVYNTFQHLSNANILYSKNELRFIPEQCKNKTFIANNTINFYDFPAISSSKEEIKKELGLPYKKIVLFVGRIQKRKKLDVLIRIFGGRKEKDVGLVIAGPDMPVEYSDIIAEQDNICYLGAIYNKQKVNKLFKCADLFCIPGTNGLGINQAMYWGLPVLTLNVRHSPEIYYLEQGKNGFVLDTERELENKIFEILEDKNRMEELSKYAKQHIREEASPEKMFEGFITAIEYLERKRDG
ncbi:glycosyltransferase [Muricauda sp. HICW]|uniref:Glycosyltransferase n=1 Tax=Flagellimonas chongwuensis TaxID=2697365 RepID=A0A850NCN8_9FLAO|nr:glycosyltransferase family 4 protein [Allomuricauda chongwuensis]NVN17056.1 glycosyltransferase [Allomuricauda chongwuensis]